MPNVITHEEAMQHKIASVRKAAIEASSICDSPEMMAILITEIAQTCYEGAADCEAAWGMSSGESVWNQIAAALEAAAVKIENSRG